MGSLVFITSMYFYKRRQCDATSSIPSEVHTGKPQDQLLPTSQEMPSSDLYNHKLRANRKLPNQNEPIQNPADVSYTKASSRLPRPFDIQSEYSSPRQPYQTTP